jgi:hypothetical protein
VSDPNVRELTPKDTARWSAFVSAEPEADLYHTLLWRDVIKQVFRHEPRYLIAKRLGEVTGILPLFLVRLPLLGAKLVSIPYDIGSGGPLAVDEPSALALARRAVELARELGVNHLELRGGHRRDFLEPLGFERSEPVLISEMKLGDEREVWSRVTKDHRKAMRKAERRGVRIREAASAEDFARFYEIYLRAFHEFGTPPYPPSYFPTLYRLLNDSKSVRLLLAEAGALTIGGLVLFHHGPNLVSKFAACRREGIALQAYPALYGRAIQLGLELGCRRLSWGTSSGDQAGLLEFKERWGAQTRPACVYALPVRRAVPRLERYYNSNGLAQRLWRWLPLSATRVLGGPLNRWFC